VADHQHCRVANFGRAAPQCTVARSVLFGISSVPKLPNRSGMFIEQLAYLVFFGRRVRALLRPGAGASAGGGEQDRLILSAASFAVGAVIGRRRPRARPTTVHTSLPKRLAMPMTATLQPEKTGAPLLHDPAEHLYERRSWPAVRDDNQEHCAHRALSRC
jgi:hypothetical protein